jgi:flagellar basal-body rod protein FlgG
MEGMQSMFRGIYTAATGMLAQQAVQDSLASNMANMNTVGFKQDIPTFVALHQMALSRVQGSPAQTQNPIGDMGVGVQMDSSYIDMTAGLINHTGNSLDLALSGAGFFAVQTAQGTQYTRNGQFHLQQVNKTTAYLADANNNPVLGQKGPINLASAKEINIDNSGKVYADGKLVDQLKLANAPVSNLSKIGSNLYTISGAVQPSTATVRQGYLEQSNVSPVASMVQMITVQRAYEAAQHAITAQDKVLDKAVNTIPQT